VRVFGNRVLWAVFGPKRDEETGEWRKLHNEEISDLYCPQNIVGVIKSRRVEWACSTYGGEVHAGFWLGNLRERDHLEGPGVDGRLILKWIRKTDQQDAHFS
jgi:hypothetical protein